MGNSDITRLDTTVAGTSDYLAKKQSIGWIGSTSIHPRVENGRTKHPKVNTCYTKKAA